MIWHAQESRQKGLTTDELLRSRLGESITPQRVASPTSRCLREASFLQQEQLGLGKHFTVPKELQFVPNRVVTRSSHSRRCLKRGISPQLEKHPQKVDPVTRCAQLFYTHTPGDLCREGTYKALPRLAPSLYRTGPPVARAPAPNDPQVVPGSPQRQGTRRPTHASPDRPQLIQS